MRSPAPRVFVLSPSLSERLPVVLCNYRSSGVACLAERVGTSSGNAGPANLSLVMWLSSVCHWGPSRGGCVAALAPVSVDWLLSWLRFQLSHGPRPRTSCGPRTPCWASVLACLSPPFCARASAVVRGLSCGRHPVGHPLSCRPMCLWGGCLCLLLFVRFRLFARHDLVLCH